VQLSCNSCEPSDFVTKSLELLKVANAFASLCCVVKVAHMAVAPFFQFVMEYTNDGHRVDGMLHELAAHVRATALLSIAFAALPQAGAPLATVFDVTFDLPHLNLHASAARLRALAKFAPIGDRAVHGASTLHASSSISQWGAPDATVLGGGHDTPSALLGAGSTALAARPELFEGRHDTVQRAFVCVATP